MHNQFDVALAVPCLSCPLLDPVLEDNRQKMFSDSLDSSRTEIIVTGKVHVSCSHFEVCKDVSTSGETLCLTSSEDAERDRDRRGANAEVTVASLKRANVLHRWVDSMKTHKLGSKIQIGKYSATCVKMNRNAESQYTDCTYLFDTYLDKVCRYQDIMLMLDDFYEQETGFDPYRDMLVADDMLCAIPGRAAVIRIPYLNEFAICSAVLEMYPSIAAPIDNPPFPSFVNISAQRKGRNDWGWILDKGVRDDPTRHPVIGGDGNIHLVPSDVEACLRPIFTIRRKDKVE